MGLFENAMNAWSVLRGLKVAVQPTGASRHPVNVGSAPDRDDVDYQLTNPAWEAFNHYTSLEPDRMSIYSDMDEMFTYIIVASGLTAYIEEACQTDTKTGKVMWAKADDPKVQAELNRLYDRIEIEDRIEGDMWGTCKYGDHFTLVRIDKNMGVFDATPIEPRLVHRHEDSRRVLRGFSIGDLDPKQPTLPRYKPWDFVHFRLRSRRLMDPYGTPLFYDLRRTYKVLKLMEEQMALYRMQMHPDRLLFKIFSGNASPEERLRLMRRYKQEVEKVTSTDHGLGSFKAEHKPWSPIQNIFWTVGAGDDKSGVEKFPGSANSGDIFDVEYYRDLLFAGLRIPKAYMGFEDSQGYRGTDTLSAQSIKFSRAVKKIQRAVLAGYGRIGRIHLASRGISPSDAKNQFQLLMAPISYLDEAHKAELYAKRYEAVQLLMSIGDQMAGSFGLNKKVWSHFILKEFAGFTDSEIMQLTSPEQGTPDITFAPRSSILVFEEVDEATRKRILEAVEGNEELKRVLSELMESKEDAPSTYSSADDFRDTVRAPTSNRRSSDKALQESAELRVKGQKGDS